MKNLKIKCANCGKLITKNSYSHRMCAPCAKAVNKENKVAWAKNNPEKVKLARKNWKEGNPKRIKEVARKWYVNNPRGAAAKSALTTLNQFLNILGFSKNYDPRSIVSNGRISNKKLEKLTKNAGYPDFREECIEEKGPRMDRISITQWARAILEYRAGRKYKVAWRLTRTKSQVFETVFDFYEWQQEEGQKEKGKYKKEKENGTR